MPVPMTLSDLERQDVRVQFFSGGSPCVPFDQQGIKFGKVTHVVRYASPRPKGRGPSAPQLWGYRITYAHTV